MRLLLCPLSNVRRLRRFAGKFIQYIQNIFILLYFNLKIRPGRLGFNDILKAKDMSSYVKIRSPPLLFSTCKTVNKQTLCRRMLCLKRRGKGAAAVNIEWRSQPSQTFYSVSGSTPVLRLCSICQRRSTEGFNLKRQIYVLVFQTKIEKILHYKNFKKHRSIFHHFSNTYLKNFT